MTTNFPSVGRLLVYGVLLLAVLILVFTALDTPKMLFFGFLAYALSGPAVTLWRVRQHRRNKSDTASQNDQTDGE